MLWLTKSTVRPSWAMSFIFPRHFLWNSASPTARTSSTSKNLRLEVRGDGEGEPHVHAARVALDRRVDELLDFRERDDLVELTVDLALAHSEERAVEVDVLPARELAGESRCRPRAGSRHGREARLRPSVGSVMRERIFSRVLLPAPFLPTIPRTSPRLTSKLTSFSAQNVSSVALPRQSSEGRTRELSQHLPETTMVLGPSADAIPFRQSLDSDHRRANRFTPRRRRTGPSAETARYRGRETRELPHRQSQAPASRWAFPEPRSDRRR